MTFDPRSPESGDIQGGVAPLFHDDIGDLDVLREAMTIARGDDQRV
ncbi:MAG: hypothetical protein MUC55_09050 [Burkholderiales bacterium]|jgi:hypothetical protein|nr:hypothetical protein [Burkholderiales bacterium]